MRGWLEGWERGVRVQHANSELLPEGLDGGGGSEFSTLTLDCYLRGWMGGGGSEFSTLTLNCYLRGWLGGGVRVQRTNSGLLPEGLDGGGCPECGIQENNWCLFVIRQVKYHLNSINSGFSA